MVAVAVAVGGCGDRAGRIILNSLACPAATRQTKVLLSRWEAQRHSAHDASSPERRPWHATREETDGTAQPQVTTTAATASSLLKHPTHSPLMKPTPPRWIIVDLWTMFHSSEPSLIDILSDFHKTGNQVARRWTLGAVRPRMSWHVFVPFADIAPQGRNSNHLPKRTQPRTCLKVHSQLDSHRACIASPIPLFPLPRTRPVARISPDHYLYVGRAERYMARSVGRRC